jgi:hypothetical protein
MPEETRQNGAPAKPEVPISSDVETVAVHVSEEPVSKLSDVDFDLLYSAVEQMSNLLSDLGLFKANVSQKIARKQLPQEWSDVVEILPDKPLLQKVGEEWHWLFDINANPLQIPPVSSEIVGAAVAMRPMPLEPGQVAFTELQIKFVEEVDTAIRFYTEDRLNLESLGSDLRLVEISPTYNSFTLAASGYRANAGPGPMELTYPSLTADKPLIEEYAANVRHSLNSIKRTIFLAELLATEKKSANAPSGSRIRTEMMRLIAGDLDFGGLSTAQIDALLAEFEEDFEESEPATKAAFERIEQDQSPLDQAWVLQLQDDFKSLSLARSVMVSAAPDPVQVYFSYRARALILHARNKQPLKRLSLVELIARSAFDLPAFHGDPETIRLLDYADSLAATKKYPNLSAPVFALALLAKLGFGKQVESLTFLFAATFGEELTADLAEAARSSRRSGERAILILGGTSEERVPVGAQTLIRQQKGEGSYAAAWTISKTHAVFPIHIGDIQNLGSPYPSINDPLAYSLEFTIEIHDEGFSPSMIMVPQVPQATLGSPIVGKPNGLDEAIANIKKNLANTPTAS